MAFPVYMQMTWSFRENISSISIACTIFTSVWIMLTIWGITFQYQSHSTPSPPMVCFRNFHSCWRDHLNNYYEVWGEVVTIYSGEIVTSTHVVTFYCTHVHLYYSYPIQIPRYWFPKMTLKFILINYFLVCLRFCVPVINMYLVVSGK